MILISFLGIALWISYNASAVSTIKQTTDSSVIDRVVAIVNKDVITQSSLDHQIRIIKSQLKHANMAIPSDQKLRKSTLDQMIDRKLQLQSAKNAGIRVSTLELNAALNRISKQNHMTLSQLYEAVQKDGWTIAEFRQEIHEEMIVEKLQSMELGSKIKVTPQEIQNFINAAAKNATIKLYHLQDIFVSLPEKASAHQIDMAQQKAENIFAQLQKGKDFKQLAIESANADPSIHVGDLGWRPLSALPSVFEGYIVSMKKGQITKPIKTPNGFHMIKLIENPKTTQQQKITKEQAEQIVFQKKLNEAVKDFIEKLRSQSYIKTL